MSAHDQNRETLAVIVKKAEQKFGGPSLADFANDPPIRKHYAVAEAILREFDVTPRTEEMGPAANCHLCVGAGGYEDYDGEWAECSCQREVSQTDKPAEDEREALKYQCKRHPACRSTGWPPYFEHSAGCAEWNRRAAEEARR